MPRGRDAKQFRSRWVQGSLDPKVGWPEFKEFYEEWVRPFIKQMAREHDEPPNMQTLLALYFGLDHRTVDMYEVKATFILPNTIPYKWPHEVVTRPGEELRKIVKGNFVFIRVDNRVPKFHIELQPVTGGGLILGNEDERRVFLLTPEAFGEIRRHLKLVES